MSTTIDTRSTSNKSYGTMDANNRDLEMTDIGSAVHCHNHDHNHTIKPDHGEWTHMSILDSLTSRSSAEFNSADNSRLSRLAVNASWLVNWFLLAAKLFAVITSSSKAVTAALADSAVDLVSQAVLALADRYMAKHSPDYPVGRSRLEALSVIACAFIMSMASIEGN